MTNSAPGRSSAIPGAGRYSETALSGIYEISKIVTSPASLKVMLNNVVSVMSSFLDMRLATLALLDDKGDPEKGKGPTAPDHRCDSLEYDVWRIVSRDQEYIDLWTSSRVGRKNITDREIA